MAISDRKPKNRPGYRWEYRTGCDCPNCPWGKTCVGRTVPHWIEVVQVYPTGVITDNTER